MDNYEEYFLLYVDDELTPAERASVETFLLVHPELRSELDLYMDTRLLPEATYFPGKDDLLRPSEDIHASNIEEWQVQWLDGELDDDTAARVEAFTNTHPEARENMAWLRKAKLEPEAIVFPHKASLYRRSEERTPVFRMQWVRIAVAAAVLITAGLLWLDREPAESVADTPVMAEANAGAASGDSTPTGNRSERSEAPDQKNEVAVASDSDRSPAADPRAEHQAMQRDAGRIGESKKAPTVTYASVDRNTITAPDATDTRTVSAEAPTVISIPSQTSQPQPSAPVQEDLARHVKTDYVSDALYTEQIGGQEEFSVEEQRHRKGFRGIIRKVNRIYNKATNPDPEKATVKIASFEIGLPR